MTTADKPRRSRKAWPEPLPEPPGEEWAPRGHTHKQPRAPLVIAYVAIALLAVEAAYIFIYILGRGQARDEELQRIDERVTRSICDLLDQLPEGGLLDRPRLKYGCGPGIPIEDFPPEVQQQLREQEGAAAATPETSAPAQPTPQADPGPPSTDGASGPQATAEPPPAAPTTAPDPLLSVVCDLTTICLEAPL